jgi:membrane fusion protein, heavy metal efflux system
MFKRTIVFAVLGFTLATSATAGPGHDHDVPAASANSNSPRREPDGSVFLPKPSQRQLAVRTRVLELTTEPRAFELPGKVVLDPATGGRVQATQAGRLQPGPRGMPQPGTRVTRGEVLAYVAPSVGAIELANQRSSASEIAANLESAKKRLARLQQLEGSVPQREIDDAKISVASLAQRASSVNNSLSSREALVAPVSGVIASVSANAMAGQLIDAREVMFEITNPQTITIEATAFDAAMAADIASGASVIGGRSVPLAFAGAASALREGQLPLMFRASSGKNASYAAPMLGFGTVAIGESVKVVVQSKSRREGIAVPSASLMKNPSNQDIVWIHEAAERFVPQPVRFVPLDGARVLVTDGLKAGARLVTDGASLVNQVR